MSAMKINVSLRAQPATGDVIHVLTHQSVLRAYPTSTDVISPMTARMAAMSTIAVGATLYCPIDLVFLPSNMKVHVCL